MWTYIIPGVIGLVGVIAGALISNAFQRGLNEAETNEKIRQTCVGLIEPLQNQINELKIELQDWKNCADARAAQLRRRDITPVAFKSSKKSDAHFT